MSEEAQKPFAAPVESRVDRTRLTLFGLLFAFTVIALFIGDKVNIPDDPVPSVLNLYETVMKVPDGSTVFLQTDWTNSTRAESGGQFEALMRVLMRKNCKLAIYSMGDPQAPRVAIDEILALNEERKAAHQREYKQWTDFVSMGFFPNAEGATQAMAADLKSAWAGKKDVNESGVMTDVFQSPVLQNIKLITEAPLIAVVTPSSTFTVLVQRLSGKVPIVALVTGVMGPESQVYYASKQIQGLAVGMVSVYDLEWAMENGVNVPGSKVKLDGAPMIPPYTGQVNFGKGRLYDFPLHVDMSLLIIAVITGNILMFRSKRRQPK